MTEEIKRRIELKRQLVTLTKKEIKALEVRLKMVAVAGDGDPGEGG